MDKTEKVNQRARDAIIALLVAMEHPKDDEERKTMVLDWESMAWVQLLKSMSYNLEHSPYANSVLIRAMKEHAQWCIREAEQMKASVRKALEAVHA